MESANEIVDTYGESLFTYSTHFDKLHEKPKVQRSIGARLQGHSAKGWHAKEINV
ncbi:hypothetical protein RvY_17861 [Ramazzottius varieornatus]|uniref:Uncharacterized protein n=1 Tax=Ramazzottius varieornatus TaxID=947166 RepID=A0A1D1W3V7_RAMVA|nr:hypothetical protein RvY_17861 [Ramazzottius varieornatus]